MRIVAEHVDPRVLTHLRICVSRPSTWRKSETPVGCFSARTAATRDSLSEEPPALLMRTPKNWLIGNPPELS